MKEVTRHSPFAAIMVIAAFAFLQHAFAEPEAEPSSSLEVSIQDLKKEVQSLNRDLFMLEEEILYPASTQALVFVSLDVGDFFDLDSVQLEIDGKEVANYLYTPGERDALARGGVQRLWTGNLKSGDHELVAFFTGVGPNERDYRRAAELKFEKSLGPKYLELRIADKASKQQPEFDIKEWD